MGELGRWADVSARSGCWFEVVPYVSLSRSRCGEVLVAMMGQLRLYCTDWMYQLGNGFPAAWVTQKRRWGALSLPLVFEYSKGGGAALLVWINYRWVGQPECFTGVGWPLSITTFHQVDQPGNVGLDGFDNPTVVLDPKAAVVSRRKPPWNVLSHKPPQNF